MLSAFVRSTTPPAASIAISPPSPGRSTLSTISSTASASGRPVSAIKAIRPATTWRMNSSPQPVQETAQRASA